MTADCDLAYLAGAIDSDGCFMIRRSTYAARVRKDAANPVFSERVCLKQVTPQIPDMLLQIAGGGRRAITKSQSAAGKPLHLFDCTDRVAARLASLLLPYLRVKRRQAELLIELRKSKEGAYNQAAYWFAIENPQWATGPLLTTAEVSRRLGYKEPSMASQAIRNGCLLALPYDYCGVDKPRFAAGLVEVLETLRTNTNGEKKFRRPPQVIKWRERLWAEVKSLNKIGLHGTPVNHRTGAYAPKMMPAE